MLNHRCSLSTNAASTKWSTWAFWRTSGCDELVLLTDKPTHGSFKGEHPTFYHLYAQHVSISKHYLIIVLFIFCISSLYISCSAWFGICVWFQLMNCNSLLLWQLVWDCCVFGCYWHLKLQIDHSDSEDLMQCLLVWKLSSSGVPPSTSVIIAKGFYVTMTYKLSPF